MLTSLWRHLLSVLLLPFGVVIVVPVWILIPRTTLETLPPRTLVELLAQGAGGLLVIGGVVLFSWCVTLFARIGRGTLAPWDPTKELVTTGPYRYVRNPMISGVAAILLGEALVFRSVPLAGWFLIFVMVNHLYFLISEEPGLERRFGASYDDYRQRVPRWIPRPARTPRSMRSR